jgi:hypothetical protein
MKGTALIVIVLMASLVAITGCIGSSDLGSIGQNIIGSNHLTITDHYMEVGDYGKLYIGGNVRNDGNDMFNGADVKMTVYDKSGAIIGENVGAVYSIYPGETGDFRGACMGNQNSHAARYKIEIVHQSWGDIDSVKTMKMVATATGQMIPVATPTPAFVSGKTTGDIVVKYPVKAEFALHYANTPDDAIHHLSMKMNANGEIGKYYTGPRPVGEDGTYIHQVGGHWTLLEHNSDSYKYSVPDESFGYPVPEDRQKYLTLRKDGTATLEGECEQPAQGYWSRSR